MDLREVLMNRFLVSFVCPCVLCVSDFFCMLSCVLQYLGVEVLLVCSIVGPFLAQPNAVRETHTHERYFLKVIRNPTMIWCSALP